jgi:hypothetical protein
MTTAQTAEERIEAAIAAAKEDAYEAMALAIESETSFLFDAFHDVGNWRFTSRGIDVAQKFRGGAAKQAYERLFILADVCGSDLQVATTAIIATSRLIGRFDPVGCRNLQEALFVPLLGSLQSDEVLEELRRVAARHDLKPSYLHGLAMWRHALLCQSGPKPRQLLDLVHFGWDPDPSDSTDLVESAMASTRRSVLSAETSAAVDRALLHLQAIPSAGQHVMRKAAGL